MEGVNDMSSGYKPSWQFPMVTQANNMDTSNLLYSAPSNNKFNSFSGNLNTPSNMGNTPLSYLDSNYETAVSVPTITSDQTKIMGGTAPESHWYSGALDSTDTKTGIKTGGWATPLLQTATAGMNAYLGLQQLNLMKDNLAFQKDSFSKQFGNLTTTTNNAMRDKQDARNASGSGYESTDSYMKNHGV
jgi:hypothetical protein